MNNILLNKVVIVLSLFLFSISIFAGQDAEKGELESQKRQIESILLSINQHLSYKDNEKVADEGKDTFTFNSPNSSYQKRLQTILQPHIIAQIAEYLNGPDIYHLRLTTKFFNIPEVMILYFQKNIRNTLSQWLVDPVEMFNKIPWGSLEAAYGKDKTVIMHGCFLMSQKEYQEALEEFKGKTLPDSIQQQLNNNAYENIYENAHGFTEESGRAYLEERVKRFKDEHAQQMLNEAAYDGLCGFDSQTGIIFLNLRVEKFKDNHAQQMLNRAYFRYLKDSKNRKLLEEIAKNYKIVQAQQILNNAARYQKLGFTKETGREYLEERVEKFKDMNAQNFLNNAARYQELGFTEETGREYLEDQVENFKDNHHAQKFLNDAAGYQELGFTEETAKVYLEKRAIIFKDNHAQKFLNEAACYQKLGFTAKSGREYLEERVEKFKDMNAQNFLNDAACYQKLGFTAKSGREYLERRIKDHNDIDAQEQFIMAATQGFLGFQKDLDDADYTLRRKLEWFFCFYNLASGFYK